METATQNKKRNLQQSDARTVDLLTSNASNGELIQEVEEKISQNETELIQSKTEAKENNKLRVVKLPKSHVIPPFNNRVKWNDKDCDQMLLNDSSTINVKILQISEYEIQYRKCNEVDGPIYIIRKSKVAEVYLSNGDHMQYGVVKISTATKNLRLSWRMFILNIVLSSLAFISFVMSFFIFPFVFISLAIAWTLGLVALIEIPLTIITRVRAQNKWSFWALILMGIMLVLCAVAVVLIFI